MPGAQPLAVDDAHAAHVRLERVDEELPQRLLRLGDGQPMQVDVALDAVFPASQPAQDRVLDAGPVKHQLIACGERRIGAARAPGSPEHRGAIGAREAGARTRLRRGRTGAVRSPSGRTPRTASRNSRAASSALLRVFVTACLHHAASAHRS